MDGGGAAAPPFCAVSAPPRPVCEVGPLGGHRAPSAGKTQHRAQQIRGVGRGATPKRIVDRPRAVPPGWGETQTDFGPPHPQDASPSCGSGAPTPAPDRIEAGNHLLGEANCLPQRTVSYPNARARARDGRGPPRTAAPAPGGRGGPEARRRPTPHAGGRVGVFMVYLSRGTADPARRGPGALGRSRRPGAGAGGRRGYPGSSCSTVREPHDAGLVRIQRLPLPGVRARSPVWRSEMRLSSRLERGLVERMVQNASESARIRPDPAQIAKLRRILDHPRAVPPGWGETQTGFGPPPPGARRFTQL